MFSSLSARPVAPPQTPLPRTIPAADDLTNTPAFAQLRESGELVSNVMRTDLIQAAGDLQGFMANNPNSAEYTALRNECWIPYAQRPFVPIPPNLSSQWEPTENVRFGLLPEINRAWWAWKNKLTLWDLVNGEETYVFDDQPLPVTSVALVKPKRDVFLDDVSYLIILVSPALLTFYAISPGLSPTAVPPPPPTGPPKPSASAITLFALDITVPTHAAGEMRSVVGTDDGRVFMCGEKDGCIYELGYQRKEAWFGKRAWLENKTGGGVAAFVPSMLGGAKHDFVRALTIDSPRNCLYALTTAEDISLYYLATRPPSLGAPSVPAPAGLSSSAPFTHIYTARQIFSVALSLSPSNPSLPARQTFRIVSLHPTLPEESKAVHLVGVTATGVRLYFSYHRRIYSYGGWPNASLAAPVGLELWHVRSPPTIPSEAVMPRADPTWYGRPASSAPTTIESKPPVFELTAVSASQLSASEFLLAHAIPGTTGVRHKDAILACTPDLARLGGYNAGDQSRATAVPGQPQAQTTALAPIAQKPVLTESWSIFPIDGATGPLSIAPLRPPVLLLPDAPQGGPGAATVSSELVLQFSGPAQVYGVLTTEGMAVLGRRRPVDVLAMLIERAGRSGQEEQVVQFWDVWGRDQACAMALAVACGNGWVERLDDSAGADGVKVGAARLFQRMGGIPTRLRISNAGQEDPFYFSGKHAGLVIYVSRLLRPIWKLPVAKIVNKKFETNVPSNTLVGVQTELNNLKLFMDREPMAFEVFVSQSTVESAASEKELGSVRAIKSLVGRTIEAISFMQLVVDFNMNDIIAQCEPAMQQLIPRMTYEDLLVTERGTEVARALVNAIINHQIARQRSVDAVSETLQQRCGSFCNPEDVILYKGLELIRNARAEPPAQRQTPLQQSLRMFLQAARAIRPLKLSEYCKEYCALDFPQGAVGLPLQCATEWDSFDEGATWRLTSTSKDDPRYQKYQLREAAYNCVLDGLKYFEDRVVDQVNKGLDFTEAETLRKSALNMALASKDPIFHRHLYDWFIAEKQSSRLLELRTPFIEVYLADPPMTLFKSELLWQYYVRNDRSAEAAVVLLNMAHLEDPNLSLEQRIEYLSRAAGNAQRLAAPVGDQSPVEFLTDLEERQEVAQLQAEIYVLLESQYDLEAQTKRDLLLKLSSKLWTITELYQYFAVPYSLNFVKLLILHVSDHQDMNLVMGIWKDIITEAQEKAPQRNTTSENSIQQVVSRYGKRLYPSNVAFPIGLLFPELLRYQWDHKTDVPHGWAREIFVSAGVEWRTVFEALEALYQDQSSRPWSSPEGVKYLQMEIAVFLNDWYKSESNPLGHRVTSTFPAEFVDAKVNLYLTQQSTEEGRTMLADLSRAVRRTY